MHGRPSSKRPLRVLLALAPLALAAGLLFLARPGPGGGGHPAGGGAAFVDADAPQPAFVDAAHEACAGRHAGEKVACYEPLLLARLKALGVRPALDALRAIGAGDLDVERDGHVFAHAIGLAAYTTPAEVPAVFGRCTEVYQSGCHHGVIQAYFARLEAVRAEDVNALCRSYRTESGDTWLLFQCVHGLGHGLTMLYDHDLRRALGGCDLLVDDWDRQSCYGGAFMENIVHATNPHHAAAPKEEGGEKTRGGDAPGHAGGTGHPAGAGTTTASGFKPLDPADPLHPCSALEERYLRECYGMQTSAILHHNGGDITGAARACDGAPERWRPACYQSLGRDVSSYTLQDHAESIRLCSLGESRWQPWCYVGVVKNFVDLTARTDDGFAFCRAVPGEANKAKCYEALGEQIAALKGGLEAREALCRAAEEAYLSACRYGARLERVRPAGLPAWPDHQDA